VGGEESKAVVVVKDEFNMFDEGDAMPDVNVQRVL
jgi:hypothetical protein